ncbi:hypothetical protein ACSVJV_003437 [Vibrio cholerae]|uniref:hypothetical protein n=1 Tax=Vibrio cholerae TaxID=666 RepID=UPI001D344739|nr:hypothetical protein [Vibrio cholerae]EGR1041692.1 hypothetical protein [Vibrio cholerae]HDL9454361.1 hypothetical protein [Vibrio cholerae]HDZ9478212.1 hypothetical protein [Vibrio cholerae]
MSVTFVTIDGIVRPISNGRRPTTAKAKQPFKYKKPTGFSSNSKLYNTERAFTVPNTACPSCGASVYYYEHPNGAKVYFDQLGPPWPKHPCTTTSPSKKTSGALKRKIYPEPEWKQSHWKPLIIEKKVSISSGSGVRIQAKTNEFTVRFELKTQLLKQKFCSEKQVDQLVMLARKIEDRNNPRAEIAITSGHVSWVMVGELVDVRPALAPSQAFSPTTGICRFNSQGKERIPLSSNVEKKKVTFDVIFKEQSYCFTRSGKKPANSWLLQNTKSLQAWVEETKKHIRIYIVHPSTFQCTNMLFRKVKRSKQEEKQSTFFHALQLSAISKQDKDTVLLDFNCLTANVDAVLSLKKLGSYASLEDLLTGKSSVELVVTTDDEMRLLIDKKLLPKSDVKLEVDGALTATNE